MLEVKILLNSIDDVKDYCNKIFSVDCKMFLCSGEYKVDARSIMGVFSLDLSSPITFVAQTDDEELISKIKNILNPYLAN